MSKHIYWLLIICLVENSFQQIIPQPQKSNDGPKQQVNNENFFKKIPTLKLETKKDLNKSVYVNPNQINNSTSTEKPKVFKDKEKASDDLSPQIESGAVIRGVLVIVGLSMIFIVYLALRNYGKKRASPIVKKYGVMTRRSDVEMRPLPLDDEDEDETVFDVGNFRQS